MSAALASRSVDWPIIDRLAAAGLAKTAYGPAYQIVDRRNGQTFGRLDALAASQLATGLMKLRHPNPTGACL